MRYIFGLNNRLYYRIPFPAVIMFPSHLHPILFPIFYTIPSYPICIITSSTSPHPLTPSTLLRRRRSNRRPICDPPIRHNRILAITTEIILRRRQAILLRGQKRIHLAPSVRAVAASGETGAQREGALVDDEVDVGGGRARGVGVGVGGGGAVGGDRVRGFDDFDVEAGAEGLEVGDDEGAIAGDGALFGQDGGELGEAEGGQDGGDVRVVGEVKVEGLVEGEGGVLGVEGDVGLRGGLGEEVALESVDELLDIANAHGTAGGGLEVIVARKVQVNAVFEALPFLIGEEVTPRAVAKSHSLIRTQRLGVVYGRDVPLEAGRHGVEACGGVLQVYAFPDNTSIGTTCGHSQVRVVAIVVAS